MNSTNWLVDVLSQLVAKREAEMYLQRFTELQGSRALLIRVDGPVVATQLDELAAGLAFLYRLGLLPVVLTDLSDHIEALGAKPDPSGPPDPAIDEARMAALRPLAQQRCAELVAALESRGVQARALPHAVFTCQWAGPDRERFVGRVEEIDVDLIQGEIGAGRLVVLSGLGETSSGQQLILDSDSLTLALSARLQPFKIVFLTAAGALHDSNDNPISAISLTSDYDYLVVQSLVRPSARQRTGLIYRMLDALDESASVSVTRPADLIRELFTHTGSGTLVRKGEPIHFHEAPDVAHIEALPPLLEACFGRRLRPGWLERQDISGLLMADSGRAAALLMRGYQGVPYLDKIMVTPAARGEGLGAALWQALRGRFPALYWRSRANNPINSWYFRRAQTAHTQGRWVVFTTGISDFELLGALRQEALTRDSGWAA